MGTAAVLPTVWNLCPEREHAASRIESEKVAGIYNALTWDPALKSRIANAHVNVWISHTASDSYALQAGDECALYLSFTPEYDSDEAFAADCQAVMQAADANGLGFTTYYFSSCDDLQEGTRYTLDCNAAFPVGLTTAQLAGRVEKEYYYDGSASPPRQTETAISGRSWRMRLSRSMKQHTMAKARPGNTLTARSPAALPP